MYRALKDPIFAKNVFKKLPTISFEEEPRYKDLAIMINRYYQTQDKFLDENTFLTLAEEKLSKQRKTLEEQESYFDTIHGLYSIDDYDQNDEIISDSIQKYVRTTLATATLRDAISKNALSEPGVVEKLADDLKQIGVLDVGGKNSTLFDFFEDVEQKKEQLNSITSSKQRTGFMAIDYVADGGLAFGEMGLINASSGGGKALTNPTPVKTPIGDIAIGDIKVGQKVFGRDGKVQTVKGVFPQGKLAVYLVEFSDGTIVECNDEHLWTYQTKSQRGADKNKFKTSTLRHILDNEKLETKQGNKNLYIPMAEPVEYEEKDLVIPSYTLGALLGDGSFRSTWTPNFTNSELDIVARVNKELATLGFKLGNRSSKQLNEYSVNWISHEEFKQETKGSLLKQNKIKANLVELGLWGKKSGDKFIPDMYLKGSIQQRLDLLQGLIDTDGWARNGSYSYTTKSEQLSKDVKELVESLGGTAKSWYKIVNNTAYYMLTIKNGTDYSYHSSVKHSKVYTGGQAKAYRQIVAITKTNRTEEMTCISVDSADSLFLTSNYVVTHNTMWAVNQTTNYVKQGLNVLYIVLEENLNRMLLRFEQAISQVEKSRYMPQGKLDESMYDLVQKAYAQARSTESGWGSLLISKHMPQQVTPAMLEQLIIDATIRKGKKIDVVLIDYPDLMKNPYMATGVNESKAGGQLYEDLRRICQEYDYICWAFSQLNRSSYDQGIKTVAMIEGSKQKINACEFVGTLNQTPEEFKNGFIRLYSDKVRNNSGIQYDKMLYFKVLPETMTIRDNTQEERREHEVLLQTVGEDSSSSYKKETTHSARDIAVNIDAMNSKLAT